MSLFMCRKCGCVENTACCNYWFCKVDEQAPLCSACDPEIKQWHGRFARRSAVGMQVDRDGHLWGADATLPNDQPYLGVVLAGQQRQEQSCL